MVPTVDIVWGSPGTVSVDHMHMDFPRGMNILQPKVRDQDEIAQGSAWRMTQKTIMKTQSPDIQVFL